MTGTLAASARARSAAVACAAATACGASCSPPSKSRSLMKSISSSAVLAVPSCPLSRWPVEANVRILLQCPPRPTQASCRGMALADTAGMHTLIARGALSLACAGFLLLVLGACSAPQLAYNSAPLLLRYKLYNAFDPNDEQDVMMSAALRRLHDWHRHNELPAYAEMLDRLAVRVEAGLDAADIAQTRELAQARYERLAAQAVDEAIPILRTLDARNFTALRRYVKERNEDYADEFLDGNEAERLEAMVESLTDHVERWVGDLNATQTRLLTEFAARHPHFAELRLENRRHLQA